MNYLYIAISVLLLIALIYFLWIRNPKKSDFWQTSLDKKRKEREDFTDKYFSPIIDFEVDFEKVEPTPVKPKERFATKVYRYLVKKDESLVFIREYKSLREAEKKLGISRYRIKRSCQHGVKIKRNNNKFVFSFTKKEINKKSIKRQA